MGDESRFPGWLGPVAAPVSAIVTVLGLIGVFKTDAEALGWKIVAGVGFLVSLIWAIWYTFGKTTQTPSMVGGEPQRVLIHPKTSRFISLLLPAAIVLVTSILLVAQREPDYTGLFTGGGPYSPIVVFDSKPRGANVKIAWIIYAEDDPFLQGKDKGTADRIFGLGRTLCRTRVSQGQYWAVFELNGHRLTTPFTALGATVVTVDFRKSTAREIHPR